MQIFTHSFVFAAPFESYFYLLFISLSQRCMYVLVDLDLIQPYKIDLQP